MPQLTSDDFPVCCPGASVRRWEETSWKSWNGEPGIPLWTRYVYTCEKCGRRLDPLAKVAKEVV